MTYLSNLLPTTTKPNKRLGRGYGSGKGGHTTNRGQKGQKARTKIHPTFMGTKNKKSLIQRLPLLRGKGKFKSLNEKPILVTLTQLNNFKSGATIDRDFLVSNKVIKSKNINQPIKVIANGKLSVSLKVVLNTSAKAKEQIESAGGQVV